MLALTTLSHRPSTVPTFSFFPRHESWNTIVYFPESPFSGKSQLSRELVCCRRRVAWWYREPNQIAAAMPRWSRTPADGVAQEGAGAGALEQESLLDGSSKFTALLESTLNRLSKWLVAMVFAAVILWRHDAEALWAAMGSVSNAWLSTTLKQILNQERPVPNLRSDPGMPSSHAQCIFFTTTFAVISIVQCFGVNGIAIILSALTLAFASYLSWLRVSQQFHTISQVVGGAAVGFVFSILWFWFWDAIVLNAFVSYLWVRILVFLATVGSCLGFLGYMVRYWFKYEIQDKC